jgi:hypothetical protein
MNTADIEAEALAALDNITIPHGFIDLAMEYLEEQNDSEIENREINLKSLQKAYEASENELNRLHRMYIKGSFEYESGEEEYQKLKQEQLAKKNDLKNKLSEFDTTADNWRGVTERGYKFCKEAFTAFQLASGDYRTRREILITLVDKAIVKGTTLILEISPPFVFIKKKLDEIQTKYGLTEPAEIEEFMADTANQAISEAIKLTWRCFLIDVRTFFEQNPQ